MADNRSVADVLAEWVHDPEGSIHLLPVDDAEVIAIKDPDTVAVRLMIVTEDGPIAIQTSFNPDVARDFASRLSLAADLVEGRGHQPQG